MHCSSSHWNLKTLGLIFIFLQVACTQVTKSTELESWTPEVDTVSILSPEKLKLTKEYCSYYYGLDTYHLDSPQLIVIHYTVIPTLEETIELFRQETLASNRTYINKFSSLNVGIHYVIDKDGSIYSLLPDTVIARHVIGFNHVSIGIENIAKDQYDLTAAQLESNVDLVRYLVGKHPSIKYLIGHDEYNDRSLPHYDLFLSLDSTYLPYDKPDPGREFMKELRLQLRDKYELVLEK